MLARKIVLYVFVLLQALSPLLHAHGATMDHGGFHLPGDTGLMPDQVPTLQDVADREPPVFTVDTALEGRSMLPIPGHASPSYLLPSPSLQALADWAALPAIVSGHRLSGHLIPHPCAPPGA